MRIRNEIPADISAISTIHYQAFKDHPQHAPGSEPGEPEIVVRLRAAGALSLSLVVESDALENDELIYSNELIEGGEKAGPVAHIALSPAQVGEAAQGWYLLGPVGVLPRLQGRGIGSALVREALEQMREQGAQGVVLVGDSRFYGRFGFVHPEGLIYEGVPACYVLALAFGQEAPVGKITAHPSFGG